MRFTHLCLHKFELEHVILSNIIACWSDYRGFEEKIWNFSGTAAFIDIKENSVLDFSAGQQKKKRSKRCMESKSLPFSRFETFS